MIGLKLATDLLVAAEAEASALGYEMSFAVVDAAGHTVAVHRMDGAGFFTPRIATAKAWTAVAFRSSTADLGERLVAAPFFVQAMTSMSDGAFVAGGGGIPLIIEGVIQGALGASGAGAFRSSWSA